MYCFGVDIGGTTVKLGLFKEDGTVVEKWEIVTRKDGGSDAILPDIANSIADKMGKYAIDKSEIVGVGVGVPAPVTEDGFVKQTANLGWKNKPVGAELQELTGFKVKVGNDANVAALGEMWQGGGVGNKNMVMITLGTGVGGGIIVDGKILTGVNGAAGEIGHIFIEPNETEKCGCGQTGCLEQYASATGIVRIAKRVLAKYEGSTILNSDTVTAKDVFDAVKEGDGAAIEIAKIFGDYLGYALTIVTTMIDPSIIVIGGGVSKAGEVLFDYIREPYREKVFFAHKDVNFALATLGNDAGIYGAAKMVLD